MNATYRQGESWVQTLTLARAGAPLTVGPAALSPTLVHAIEVVLHSGGATAARFRYPADPLRPELLPLTIDASAPNLVRLSLTRELTKRFVPGFLTAYVLVLFIDPAFPAGRAVELELPLGVLLQGETATL